jgi:hypothetical protein
MTADFGPVGETIEGVPVQAVITPSVATDEAKDDGGETTIEETPPSASITSTGVPANKAMTVDIRPVKVASGRVPGQAVILPSAATAKAKDPVAELSDGADLPSASTASTGIPADKVTTADDRPVKEASAGLPVQSVIPPSAASVQLSAAAEEMKPVEVGRIGVPPYAKASVDEGIKLGVKPFSLMAALTTVKETKVASKEAPSNAPSKKMHVNEQDVAAGSVVMTTTMSLDYVLKIRSSLTWLSCKKDIIVFDDNDHLLDNIDHTSIIDLLDKGLGTKIEAKLATATGGLCSEVEGKTQLTKVKSDVKLWVQRMKDVKKKSDEVEVLVAQERREDTHSASQALMRFLPAAELAMAEEALYGIGNPDVVVQWAATIQSTINSCTSFISSKHSGSPAACNAACQYTFLFLSAS